jgi:HAD superfamily hydrolase (TIGR01549 family)
MIVYKPLSDIRAISFDLDDTLYDNMPYIYEAERQLATHIEKFYPSASKVTKIQWKNIRIETLSEQPALVNDLGEMRSVTLTKGFRLAGMDNELIPHAVSDCFDHFYHHRSNFVVPKPVRKVLKKLSKKMPIAAITNGNVNLNAIGIEKYFSCIIHASPTHPMKPDRAMFDYVVDALNIPAKNILHVGDDLQKDVEGALSAGFQSAWLAVNRPMSLANEQGSLLPHIQLNQLKELKGIIKKR